MYIHVVAKGGWLRATIIAFLAFLHGLPLGSLGNGLTDQLDCTMQLLAAICIARSCCYIHTCVAGLYCSLNDFRCTCEVACGQLVKLAVLMRVRTSVSNSSALCTRESVY